MPRSLKKETLPAPQGEVSPHSSPLLLRARLLGAPAACTWQGRGKSCEGSGVRQAGTLPSQTTSTNAALNTPALRPAQLERGHKPAGWDSAPGSKQRGTPGHNPSLSDVRAHASVPQDQSLRDSVLSEPISRGAIRTHLLGDITTGRPHPRHSPQLRCRPSACVWGHRSTPARSIPPSLVLVLGIGVSRQSLRPRPCLPRTPPAHSGPGRRLQAHMARGFTR